MTTLTLSPWFRPQIGDANLKPLASGRIFTYAAGTTTKLATYQDSAGTTAHSNPIVLDSAGMPPAGIYLQARSYKMVIAAAGSDDPPTSPLQTQDNVSQISPFDVDLDITGTAGEAIDTNEWVYLSDGTGSRTAGRWYKTDQDLSYASTLARKIGIAVSVGGAAGDSFSIRVGGRATGLAGLTPGSLYYLSSTAGAITLTPPANPRRVAQSDSTTSVVIENDFVEPVKGIIPIDLTVWREVAANAIQNAAANGGLLASDTTPALERVNGATDKALRINWVAANVDEITACITYPPDLDNASSLEFHILAASGGATNSPTIQVDCFVGIGDTNCGGATAAVTGTTITEYTRIIAATDVGTHPNFASFSLTPAAHGTDALRLYATWVEYTRKLTAS